MTREQQIERKINQLNEAEINPQFDRFAFPVFKENITFSDISTEDVIDIIELEKIKGKWQLTKNH